MPRTLLTRRQLIAGAAMALAKPAFAQSAGPNWPAISIKPDWVRELNERFGGPSGSFHDDSYHEYLQTYTSSGDYLNWGKIRTFQNDDDIFITENGLPKVKEPIYPEPAWNAVTLSHFALTQHGRMLHGQTGAREEFFKATDQLIELQRPDGGFPYRVHPYRDLMLPEGWVSGMAQGNALSVFYRAMLTSDDPRYRRAGDLAYKSLMTPIPEGGPMTSLADLDPSLSFYLFLAEYPTQPVDYTLNGYMFALLGVYDWSHVSPEAAGSFTRGIDTLERLLPYHDIDGLSTYDLSHIVLKLYPYVAPFYLGIHVYLLHSLESITGSEVLKRYEMRWAAKVDEMNRPLRITVFSSDVPSPQRAGTTIKFQLRAEGGAGGDKLFQFGVRRGGIWTLPQKFSTINTFTWTPAEADEYIIGFYAKEAGSVHEFDNFQYQKFTITP
jgi:heparosan-N-sulfate-glucuronate 5-epimerase